MARKFRSAEECRKEFLKRHREWEKMNLPNNWYNGKIQVFWNRRLKALDALVRANRREEKAKAKE